MKLYDFDGMFDAKLSELIAKNQGKYKEEQWEDMIPQLYAQFGDTFIKSVGNTPNGFYRAMTDDELVKALQTHIKQQVPVSEYLCKAIQSRDCTRLLLPLLNGTDDEISYVMTILGADEAAFPRYMEMLLDQDTNEDRKNDCVDYLKQKADLVKDQALQAYEQGIEKEYMLELLSRCVLKDEKIFDILMKEFRSDSDNVPMHASYLAAYGDERALPYLLDRIDDETITFIEFQELKYAIEALGGEYTKERDFSNDPYYEIVNSHNASDVDIFDSVKDDVIN